jgi:hypothetical protein
MTDAVDKFRHWLIRKLALGDMILLNFEIRSDGKYIQRNLGPALISDADITDFSADVGIAIGRSVRWRAAMSFANLQCATIRNSTFRAGGDPYSNKEPTL